MEHQEQPKVDFSKYHLNIGIPCYGGMVTEGTMLSLIRFVLVAKTIGLDWSLDTIANESLITRARNNLMAKMMENEEATHFMFIDADIRFDPMAIVAMLLSDKDVIGGLYPKKGFPIDYNINLLPHTDIEGDLFTVGTLASGFLMMKREVYSRLIEAYPETKYIDDVNFGKQYEPYMYAIFDTYIDHEGRYLSEDWAFCKRWAKIGGKLWAHGGVLLNHLGYFEFSGDLSAMPDFAQPKGDISEFDGQQMPDALRNVLRMRKPQNKTEEIKKEQSNEQ